MPRYVLSLLLIASCVAPASAADMLMVTAGSSPDVYEGGRKSIIEGWGHTVTTIQDSSSQASFDAAVAAVDVVYVPATIQDHELLYKLRSASVGVITETMGLDTEFGFTTSDGYTTSSTTIEQVDNSHPVTTGLSTGTIAISGSNIPVSLNGNSVASGMTVLATKNGGQLSLGVIETGGALANTHNSNSTASGRRVRLPWGNITTSLNANGESIMRQAIDWAAEASGDLLLHWTLDESSGAAASDSSVYERDGSITGTASWVEGRRNNAVDVDSSSKVEVTGLLGEPTSFTIAAWVDTDSVGANGGVVVSVGDHVSLVMDEPHFNGGLPSVVFNYSPDYFEFLSGGEQAAGGGWRHYAATFDSASDTLKLYIDGKLAATKTTTREIDWSAPFGSTTVAGGNSYPIGGYEFDGRVDDVRVYRSALSDQEIAKVYGLIAHWKLDESSGSTAYDSSLSGHDAAVAGTTSWTSGVRGNGIDLSTGTVAVSDLLGEPENFTVACWANLDVPDSGGAEAISVGDYIGLRLDDGGNGAHIFFRHSSGWDFVASGISVAGTGWRHFVATFDDASDTLRLYIDGTLVASKTTTYSLDWSGLGTQTMIGAHGNGEANHDFDGQIDDVRVYNRAIADPEIAEIYGLIAHWKLDESSGSVAVDSSLAGNDATRTGSADWSVGRLENGHGFDYTDGEEYFTAPSNEALNDVQEGDYTLMAYFKPNSIPPGSGSDNDSFYSVVAKSGWHCGLLFSNEGEFQIDHWITGNAYAGAATDGVSYESGRFYHVAGVVSRTDGTVHIYVDGELIDTVAYTPGTAAREYGSNPWRLGMGEPGGGSYGYPCDGVVDDARIYNRALSADEIAEIAASSLIAHWRFDESSGTTAADDSVYGNDGVYSGGPTLGAWAPHEDGVDFTSDTQNMTAPSSDSLDSLGENGASFSVSLWVKPGQPAGHDVPLVHKGATNQQRSPYLGLNFNDNRVEYAISATGNWNAGGTSSAPLIADRWSHVVLVKEAREYRLYINGELDSTRNVTDDSYGNSGNLYAGDSPYQTGEACSMDDLRIYSYPLSDSEIAELYGLLGHWKFDEGVGTTTADGSYQGNDASFSTGSPEWVTGVRGNALKFDGTNDASTDAVFDPPEEGCIAFWIRCDEPPSSRQRPWGLSNTFESFQDADGLLRFDLNWSGAPDTLHPTENFAFETRWRHVLVNFRSSTDEYELYFDGQLDISGVYPSDMTKQAANYLMFGNRTGTTQRFTGALDDFRIYNRWLDHAEVAEIYGLIGWWMLDESSGSVAADSSGSSLHGDYNGSPTLAAAGPDSGDLAASFDGIDDSVSLPTIYENFDDGAAISAWARPTAENNFAKFLQVSEGTSNEIDLGRQGTSTDLRGVAHNFSALNATNVVDTGVWRQYAMSIDATGHMKLYRDGVLINDGYQSTPVDGPRTTNWIGASNWGVDGLFEGQMRDVRLYNRPLTEEEARKLFFGSWTTGLRITDWVEVANP